MCQALLDNLMEVGLEIFGHLPYDNDSFICEHMDLMKLSLGEHSATGLSCSISIRKFT